MNNNILLTCRTRWEMADGKECGPVMPIGQPLTKLKTHQKAKGWD